MNISKIIIIIFLLGLLSCPAEAATGISTSSANPDKIFKCGESTISATFFDDGVYSVNAIFTSEKAVQPMVPGSGRVTTETETTTVPMTHNGTHWVGTFGDNSNLLWGYRTITYEVNRGIGGTYIYVSSTKVLVYSDECTGTGVSNYTQVSSGLGKYTRMLYNGQYSFIGTSLDNSFIGWALFPWIEVWGYLFYVLVIFTVCTTIYLKTQNITQPLMIGIFFLLVFASTMIFDSSYRQWVVFILAIAMTAIYYKIFVRD